MLSLHIWIACTTFIVLDEADLVEKTGLVRIQLTCDREALQTSSVSPNCKMAMTVPLQELATRVRQSLGIVVAPASNPTEGSTA